MVIPLAGFPLGVGPVLESGAFRPVRPIRVSQGIAAQIREAILAGRLAPGDRLPAERQLVTLFGASRISVREALRILESTGLIAIRSGVTGGAFVAEASADVVRDSFFMMMRLNKTSHEELIEARKIVEVAATELAAVRATADHIALLEASVSRTRQAVEAGSRDVEASYAFHLAIAQAAANRVLLVTIETCRDLLVNNMTRLHEPKTAVTFLKAHREILEAIRQRDVARSRELMLEHMCDIERRITATFGAVPAIAS